jgi:hypothetical protein
MLAPRPHGREQRPASGRLYISGSRLRNGLVERANLDFQSAVWFSVVVSHRSFPVMLFRRGPGIAA